MGKNITTYIKAIFVKCESTARNTFFYLFGATAPSGPGLSHSRGF